MIKPTAFIAAFLWLVFAYSPAKAQIFNDPEVPIGHGVIITHTAFSDATYYPVDFSEGSVSLNKEPIIVEAPNWNKKQALSDPNLKKRKRNYYGMKVVPEGEYALLYLTASSGSHLRQSKWIWCYNQNAEVFKVEEGKITVMPPRVYRIIKDPPLDIDADKNFEAVETLINSQTSWSYEIKKAENLGAIQFEAENDKECKVSDRFNILNADN